MATIIKTNDLTVKSRNRKYRRLSMKCHTCGVRYYADSSHQRICLRCTALMFVPIVRAFQEIRAEAERLLAQLLRFKVVKYDGILGKAKFRCVTCGEIFESYFGEAVECKCSLSQVTMERVVIHAIERGVITHFGDVKKDKERYFEGIRHSYQNIG